MTEKSVKHQLSFLKKLIPKEFEFQFTNPKFEKESKEYWACRFEINDQKVIYRKAKITPTKVGQFVTLWKRISQGPIAPFYINDRFDLVIIAVAKENKFGLFVFPKSVLVAKSIVSNKLKEGKRGFRVYPFWDEAKNNQAIKTQQWQLDYFLSLNKNSIDVNKAILLFNLNDN